jgi:transposase
MRRWPGSTGRFRRFTSGSGARPSRRSALRATLLQLLYSIRSERQLVERIEFDMLFRWFIGLSIDEKVFDASTFSKNRDRLLTHEIAQEFLSSLIALPEVKGLLSAEHFSVDGTLLKAWASMKSFRPKSLSSGEDPRTGSGEPPSPGRNGEADFRNTKRSNATHASTTDKDARLYRKGAGRRRQGLRRRGLRRGPEGAQDRAAHRDQRDGEQAWQRAQDRRAERGRRESALCD